MKKIYVVLLIVISLILVGFIAFRYYLNRDIQQKREITGTPPGAIQNPDSTLDFKSLFIAKIQQMVYDGSKRLYHVTIQDMETDLVESRVYLKNVKLNYDNKVLDSLHKLQQAPDDVIKASFATLQINGINLDDVLTRNTIDFKDVLVTAPDIDVYHNRRSYNLQQRKDTISMYDRIMKNMDRISIGKVWIQKGNFTSHNLKQNKRSQFKDVDLQLHNILLDSTTEFAKDRFLFSKNASLTLQNYTTKLKDDLYNVKIGKLVFTAPQNELQLSEVAFASPYNREQFSKKVNKQQEQYKLNIPSVTFDNINLWNFIQDEIFIANEMNVRDARLTVFLDRSMPPPDSKMGNFLQQMIMKLPMDIHVSKTMIQNMDLVYEEYNPVSQQTGKLHLDKVNLDIRDITNNAQRIREKKNTIVNARASFEGIPVTAKFVFDLVKHKEGKFSANIQTGSFDGARLNGLAVPLGLVKIERGTVNELNMQMQGNNLQASGQFSMLYDDLKLSMYEKERGEKGLDKKGLISIIANAFVLKSDNPSRNNEPRKPPVSFQRIPEAGFFNLVWKTMLNGILKTVGANPKLGEKKK